MIRLIAMMFFALAACSVLDAPVAQLERWQKQRAAGAMAAIADEPVVPDCAPGRGEPCQRLHLIRAEACLAVAFADRGPDAACPGASAREAGLLACAAGAAQAAEQAAGEVLLREEFYSTGGGFIVRAADFGTANDDPTATVLPHPFWNGASLLGRCRETGLELNELVMENEGAFRPATVTRDSLLQIWAVMQGCITRGFSAQGLLPGVLKVRRRAPKLHRMLNEAPSPGPMEAMDWVNAWALAVNEENAAGGRVVTAPTNGAAGIVPAVLMYYRRFEPGSSEQGVVRFLLAAGAIGMLYKRNASISGAEMGCQGEVGVACSMAAAGLVAALNGTNEQLENAAEIGMEHNLGLTCDPIAGLVQIPCIERNAMGAVKAINAARLAMRGDGTHKVSLDMVIATMRQTGEDMKTSYKETSQGGLAVNVPEC